MIAPLHLAGAGLALCGLALLLVAAGEALGERPLPDARGLGVPGRPRSLLRAGLVLTGLGLLLAARVLWTQIGAAVLVIAWCGWIFWEWLESRETPPLFAAEAAAPRPAPPPPPRPESWATRYLFWAELAVALLVAPALWFPTAHPTTALLAAGLLVLAWIAAAFAEGEIWPASPYGLALLLLAIMAAVSAARSAAPDLTLPKVGSLLLGLAFFRVALRSGRRGGAPVVAVGGLLALGLALATIGLLGGPRAAKIPALAPLAALLPRLTGGLPEAQGGAVNPNQVGGTLLLVAPLALGLALAPLGAGERAARALAIRLAAAGASGVLLGQLVLTQSRSAWIGMGSAFLALLALRWRRGALVAALLVVLLAGALAQAGWTPASFAAALADGRQTPIGTLYLDGRLAIWSGTVDRIAASPWLGYPLGTFRLDDLPDGTDTRPLGAGVPHAHNVFLQVAYDVGLPGLVAYLALLVGALRAGLRIVRCGEGLAAGIALGAVCCLVAYHVYGLTDALALGAKPAVLLWALLGLIAGLAEQRAPRPASAGDASLPDTQPVPGEGLAVPASAGSQLPPPAHPV